MARTLISFDTPLTQGFRNKVQYQCCKSPDNFSRRSCSRSLLYAIITLR